jgi:predicted kinase
VIDATDALLARAEAGRARRLHGRLACRAVFVRAGQAVRFTGADPEARGDVAEDVAALAIDLRSRGAAKRAEAFAAAYAWCADDHALYRVLDGLALEAAARLALEAAVSADRGDGAPAPGDYLRAALDGERPARVAIAVGGAVASGKSTVARALSRRLAAPRVAADRVQRALLAPLPARVAHEVVWEPDFAERVYQGMLRRAADVLASGRPVVLDACFGRAAWRREAAALAARHGAAFVFAHCEPPPEDVAARLARRDERDGAPGAWEALARLATERWQPPGPDEPGRTVRVDTARPRREWLGALGIAA